LVLARLCDPRFGVEDGPTLGTIMVKKGMAKVYRIEVKSELGEKYASAFEGMRMETRDGQTILTGEVKDQSHLFDILDRLNGLG
jgi:endonuclease YncB( thermonuclease family)